MGMFDDLIPGTQANLQPAAPTPPAGMFDDLIQPAPAGAPSVSPISPANEGMFFSMRDDGSAAPGSVLRPIVEGIKNALPAAARYQPGTGDEAGVRDVIKAAVDASPIVGTGTIPSVARASPAAIPAARQLGTTVPGATGARVSTDALKTAARAAYGQADDAGVIFSGNAMGRLGQSVVDDLTEFGYHPKLQPKIATVLDEIGRLSEDNVTLKGVDTLRKIVGQVSKSTEPAERALAARITDKIDDLILNPATGDVIAGDSQAASAAMGQARTLWSRMRKTELVEDAIDRATTRAASTGSGGNINNALRQNIRAIIENPKKARGFSPEELDIMRSVVKGTTMQGVARLIGKLSPEGNGLMLALALAGTLHTPGAAAAPLVGFIAKRMADRSTLKSADNLVRAISSGRLEAPLANWNNVATQFTKGEMTAQALRFTAMAIAQQMAGITGIDQQELLQEMLQGVKAGET